MLSTMYTVLFILSLGFTVLLFKYRDRVSAYYLMLFMSIMIMNMGYVQLSNAHTLEAAILANQTSYLGSSFAPFFLTMCFADLCKVKISSFYRNCLMAYAGIILLCVFTINKVGWYYKDVSFEIHNGVGTLVKEYGPLHNLLPLYLLLVVVLNVIFILRAVRFNREVSLVTTITLSVSTFLIVTLYILERVKHYPIETLPISYVAGQAAILFLVRRIQKYNQVARTADYMMRSKNHSFLVFDSCGRFLGADDTARKWFGEIAELRIDRKIKKENTDFLIQVGKWIRGEDDQDTVHFHRDDFYIEVQHRHTRWSHDKEKMHSIYLWDETQQYEYTKLLEHYGEDLEKEVSEKTEKLQLIQNDILANMANIVENRDSNTGGHIVRTSDVVQIFVRHLQEENIYEFLTKEYADNIIKAASLHDFGKVAISDVLLNKPGRFTPEEFDEMKKHSQIGAKLVARMLQSSDDEEFKRVAINVAHYHHERWDGSGYPKGLRGDKIPFEARIMALADVFDALVSKRCYKEKYDYDKAFEIMRESANNHFDPDLCMEFIACRTKLENLYDAIDE